jgi:hypothetical protein
MEAFGKSLVAATLMAACTASASAQNSPATQGAQTGSAVNGLPARADRDGKRSGSYGAAPTDHAAAMAPQLILEPNAGSGTQIPVDRGTHRGGPENPSGLKKPD